MHQYELLVLKYRMAHLVMAALEINTRRFCPGLLFAVFSRQLTSPLRSFINLEVFEYNFCCFIADFTLRISTFVANDIRSSNVGWKINAFLPYF